MNDHRHWLDFLTKVDFTEHLPHDNALEYNRLLLAHMAVVILQSQGVKSLSMKNSQFRVFLTNGRLVTNTRSTGGNLTVWHKDFDFYRPSHLKDWIEKKVALLQPIAMNFPDIEVEKERKKDHTGTIYQAIIEPSRELKSYLSSYFLEQALDEKTFDASAIEHKKIKL